MKIVILRAVTNDHWMIYYNYAIRKCMLYTNIELIQVSKHVISIISVTQLYLIHTSKLSYLYIDTYQY